MNLILKSVVSIAILLTAVASAQVSTGTPPFGSFGGGPFDTVNLGNLNVHLSIPVIHKAGRGLPFTFDLSYDSSIWYPVTSRGTTQWTPTQNWGWTASTLAVLGYLSPTTTVQTQGLKCALGWGGITTTTTTYAYVDSKGRSHPFPGSTWYKTYVGGCSGPEWSAPLTAVTTDGSGWTLYAPANQIGVTVTTLSGIIVATNVGFNSGSGWYQDTNGNELTVNSSGQYFDTLSGTTAVLTQAGSGTPTSPVTYTYTAPSGGSPTYTVNYTQYTVATNFGVSGINEFGSESVALVSSITLPDQTSYSFVYETTPGSCTPLPNTYSNCVTGRIEEVTLPTLGTITYGYGGSNGIYSDGSTAGLTRGLSATTTAPAQSWSYTRTLVTGTPAPGSTWTTTVTDPSSNQTVINFAEDSATNGPTTVATYNFYETQRKIYQGSISSNSCSSTITNNCLLLTTVNCYNANYASCATATVSSPATQTDTYVELLNGSTRLSEVLYNGYGLVTDDKEYNYGVALGAAPLATYLVRETAISYNTSLTNHIVNRPSQISVSDWTSGSQVFIGSSTYGYDVGSLQTTTGTPQQKSITGSRGNLTSLSTYSSSTKSLHQTFSYYDTGNVYQANDVSSAQATYTYGACGNSFPTLISEPLSLSRSLTWNCTGGVVTQVTDENGNNVTSNYTDADFWRPSSIVDQMSNQTNINYNGQITIETALQNFNGGHSASDFLTTVDGFGRVAFRQRLQAPGSGNYDTSETDYNSLGQPYISRMPYSATASPSSEDTSAPGATTTYDAVGRVHMVTDADGGTVTYTYTNNDVLQAVGGTSGTQTFNKQFEYDGLGRLTSVCEMSTTLSGVGTCAQKTSQTGYWTKYASDALGHLLSVTQNAQAASGSQQTRSFTYDWLGRMLTESNPETSKSGVNGTITYTYDSSSNCGGVPVTGCGDLAQKTDNAGNTTYYTYDALHRVLTAGNSNISGATLRNFVYDSATGTPPNGWSATTSNPKTHVIEGKTTNTSGTTQTDEWFSYDKDGNLTDVYEKTPNSGEYYHTTASYWPTGTLETLSGIPGVPTLYYGTNASAANYLDGEGRYTHVTAASGTNPVSSVTYSTSSTTNPLGALTGVTYGSSDSDSFGYDPNTGRAGAYTFTVNGNSDTGTLNWYTNGTLKQLLINDLIPSTTDSQTCSYTYDDLARVAGTSCTSSPAWSQTFAYDAFGNIKKSGNSTFNPSYTFANGADTNQLYSIPGVSVSYDNNGNLLTDNLNKYTWDPNWGNMLSVTPQPSGSTSTATYDALGRVVEQLNGSAYTQILYSPVGKTALMSGANLTKAFVPLPGGGTAIYNSSGLAYYRHTDWLGSSRLTTTQARGLNSSQAYAPFGEQYTTYPTAGSLDPSYTGQNSDAVPSLYDFTFREHSMSQGRWISPDPLGVGAVDPANPQTWNRYAYVANNPLSYVDPLGLYQPGPGQCNMPAGDSCDGGGGPTDSEEQAFNNQYSSSYWMQQALNSYLSWINAIWEGGGTEVTTSGGAAIYLDWSVDGGVYGINENNGEEVSLAGLEEIIGAVDTGGDSLLPGPGGPGGSTGGGNSLCTAHSVQAVISGAQPTGTGQTQGGHYQTNFTFSGDLSTYAPIGGNAFSIFGINNGYRFGGVFFSLHINSVLFNPFTNTTSFQGHMDIFNPATGLLGILGHTVVDLGIGTLFFNHKSTLDRSCP